MTPKYIFVVKSCVCRIYISFPWQKFEYRDYERDFCEKSIFSKIRVIFVIITFRMSAIPILSIVVLIFPKVQ